MNPVLPSQTDLDVFLTVARGEFVRDVMVHACIEAGWELTGEDADIGQLEFKAAFGDGQTVVVNVHTSDGDFDPPVAFAPLGFFEGDDRAPYDMWFRRIADHIGGILGPVTKSGEYASEQTGMSLSYCWWRVSGAVVVLVQNEYGPPLHPDVSVWVFPPRKRILLPVTRN